jgi:transposase
MTTTAPLDERQQKALVIAATSAIAKRGNETWIVPSQSNVGKYAVTITAGGKECTCPDFELRQANCKHILAVQLTLFRETRTEVAPDGAAITTTTEAASVRVTYAQNWSAYNQAQATEKDHFCRLLKDLVANVPTPPQHGAGNRRLAMPDLLFGMAYKVYSGFSSRRFMSDLRAARDAGLVGHAASFNAIIEGMRSEEVTPILQDLIVETAKPLAALESRFAVDSTGLGTECFYRHYSAKYGSGIQEKRDYLKLHALVGTKTNVIAACRITDRNRSDSTEFKPLVEEAALNFDLGEVSADLAYSSYSNLECVERVGAKAFIPFKSSAVAVTKSHKPGSKTWTRLFHYFNAHRDEFLEHYHSRSNVECTFSMIKRVIGDTLRSRTPVAQTNEALLMVLCHNIRCLIHEAFELGKIGDRYGLRFDSDGFTNG